MDEMIVVDQDALWPRGTTGALCLTFDMDAETMWTSTDPQNSARPSVLSQGRYDVERGLSLVLDLLARNGINTTFFVPSATAVRHPDAVREILRRGHEVANHGTDHQPMDGLSVDAERDVIRKSQAALIEVCGVTPRGYRAPYFHVNPNTVEILIEEGFEYSSNMMNDVRPYLHRGEVGTLVEVPVHYMLDDGTYYYVSDFPTHYGPCPPPRMLSEVWCDELTGIVGLGGVCTLVLHPQLSGRPSRIRILQDLIDTARELETVWFPQMWELTKAAIDAESGSAAHGLRPLE